MLVEDRVPMLLLHIVILLHRYSSNFRDHAVLVYLSGRQVRESFAHPDSPDIVDDSIESRKDNDDGNFPDNLVETGEESLFAALDRSVAVLTANAVPEAYVSQTGSRKTEMARTLCLLLTRCNEADLQGLPPFVCFL
jgi:hypothetical protein